MLIRNLLRQHRLMAEAGEGGDPGASAPGANTSDGSAAGSSAGEGVSDPGSPAGEGVSKPVSTLDAVKAALDSMKDPAKSEQAAAEKAGSESPADKDGKPDATNTDADEKLPFGKHPRWKEVLAERDEALAKAKEWEPKAQQFDRLVEQVQTLGLQANEYDVALNLAGMAKQAAERNDVQLAQRALQHFEGIVNNLRLIAGSALPDDLQEDVDSGAISEQRARELARLRLQEGSLRATQARTAEQIEAERREAAEREAEQLRGSVEQALTKWESEWAKGDPDYSVLKPLVKDRIVAMMAETGAPKSVDAAVKLADEARKYVLDGLKGIRTRNHTASRIPATGGEGSPNGSQRPVPRTSLEAAQLALSRMA